MRFVNLIGVGLVLCGLAFPVLASPLEGLSAIEVPDLVVDIFKDGVRLNNVKVHLDLERLCPQPPWKISPWSFENGIYYGDLPSDGCYSVRVQKFQFGTSTFGTCPTYFCFREPRQAQIILNITSPYPSPGSCPVEAIPCDYAVEDY
jgi:hypothetical protein